MEAGRRLRPPTFDALEETASLGARVARARLSAGEELAGCIYDVGGAVRVVGPVSDRGSDALDPWGIREFT